MSRSKIDWRVVGRIVLSILLFPAVFVLALIAHGLFDLPWTNWRVLLGLFSLFALLGAYYGTIAILDIKSGMAACDRPWLRTLLCGVWAALAVLTVQGWDAQPADMRWALPGYVIGAVLGWLGWTWAKYVDF